MFLNKNILKNKFFDPKIFGLIFPPPLHYSENGCLEKKHKNNSHHKSK
jgi:hypothetical protein